MTERHENGPEIRGGQNTDTIRAAREQLEPLILAMLDALAMDAQTPTSQAGQNRDRDAIPSGAFFAAGEQIKSLIERLRRADGKDALLRLILDIGRIELQEYGFSANTAGALKRLNRRCECIALALTGSSHGPH